MKPFANLRHDVPASIVVLFVAVPLCLGIALASGAPLFAGVIAGVVGGLVVGLLSGSPLGVSGPAAGLTVIVLTAIATLGSFEVFLLAVVIAGGLQVLMGIARAGVLGYFFPSSVIKGMLSGIGIIIILKQVPHAFGYDASPEGDFAFVQANGETTLSSLGQMLERIHPTAILVTLVSLTILIFWDSTLAKRWRALRTIPGPLAAVATGIVLQVIATRFVPGYALSGDHLVSVPEISSLSGLGELLVMPDWSHWRNMAVWTTAITIAVVASLETLLCVAATDKLDPEYRVTPTNRELIAQGAGNMISGAIGGLPITQVIVRSSANIQSGGRTKLSAILHGLWLALFVLAAPGLLNMIPLAVLASILFVVGFKLARPTIFKQMWSLGKSQFLPFPVTIAGIVFTDLLTGIGVGLAVAILVILRRNYINSHFLHIEESEDHGRRKHVHMRLSEEVTFLNKGAVIKELGAIADGSFLTIDCSACVDIDWDILEVIEEFRAHAEARGIDMRIIKQRRDRAAA